MKKKASALCLFFLLLAPVMLFVQSNSEANAQALPSVPEFTLKYIDNSYEVPPTYQVNPYTGKNETTNFGEHVDNRVIEITVKNQPFNPIDGAANLYYNARVKGHFDQIWNEVYGVGSLPLSENSPPSGSFPIQNSNSQYTILQYKLTWNVPTGGKMDVQVEAMAGYESSSIDPARSHMFYPYYTYSVTGQKSGWSNTKTVFLDSTPPKISIESPQQETYNSSDVTLTFQADEQLNQTLYSLDGGENVTISGNVTMSGNTTITGLQNGPHNVTVYGWDEAGNVGASDTINFTVAVPETLQANLNVNAPVIIVTAVLIVIVAVGLVYFKKIRH